MANLIENFIFYVKYTYSSNDTEKTYTGKPQGVTVNNGKDLKEGYDYFATYNIEREMPADMYI